MEQNSVDAIILGTGAMGSMAAWQLARRGLRVVALEQFALGHDRGSSHGESRIIRQAYFEHPDYVPLLKGAYELWSELEQESGRSLFERCGLLIGGDPGLSGIMQGIDRSAGEYGVPVERLSAAQMRARFPSFAVPDAWEARFEANAGYLRVEEAVRTAAQRAKAAGCLVQDNLGGLQWAFDGRDFEVRSSSQSWRAPRLIVCAGAWAGGLLRDEGLPLEPRRVVVHWYPDSNRGYSSARSSPCFGFDTDAGFLYGFPANSQQEVKAGLHVPGDVVADPLAMRRTVDVDEHAALSARIHRHLPMIQAQAPIRSQTCIYTMTPDEHFIIDRSRRIPGLIYACGFSGHGFKFAPLVADLAIAGETPHPIGFLRRARFSGAGA
jgi:monomeric sarcosine oxidase